MRVVNEVIDHEGGAIVVLHKAFLDRLSSRVDVDTMASTIIDKVKNEIIHSIVSTYDFSALKKEIARQVREDVARMVMARHDHRIRVAVEEVMLKAEKDFEDERVKARKSEVYKRQYASRKAKRIATLRDE